MKRIYEIRCDGRYWRNYGNLEDAIKYYQYYVGDQSLSGVFTLHEITDLDITHFIIS